MGAKVGFDISRSPRSKDSTFQDHLDPSLWAECVVYIGLGVFVKDLRSVDQQLPNFLLPFTRPDSKRAKAIIFDPEFRNQPPLCVAEKVAP